MLAPGQTEAPTRTRAEERHCCTVKIYISKHECVNMRLSRHTGLTVLRFSISSPCVHRPISLDNRAEDGPTRVISFLLPAEFIHACN